MFLKNILKCTCKHFFNTMTKLVKINWDKTKISNFLFLLVKHKIM